MKEVWKDIKGFEGLYQVSNLGNVKSLPVQRTWRNVKHRNGKVHDEVRVRPGRILKPVFADTLKTVHLYTLDHVRVNYAVKRLVMETFVPDFDPTVTTTSIRHKNNDTDDCSLENLYVECSKKKRSK